MDYPKNDEILIVLLFILWYKYLYNICIAYIIEVNKLNKEEILKKYRITENTLKNWKKLSYIDNIDDIDSNVIDNIIKNKVGNRRNKRNSSENIIPCSYVKDSKIIEAIKNILKIKEIYKISNNKILHEAIFHILNKNNLQIPNQVEGILGKRTTNKNVIDFFNKMSFDYEDDNDFLGCLYMSILPVGKKDINGIFYTPYNVVNQIITSMTFTRDSKVLDPGCGSGNFLMQAYKMMQKENIPQESIISNLYGYDIDKIAVLLAKVNIYILAKTVEFERINIYEIDFLNDDNDLSFDIIIGNPPWGKKYSNEEKKELKKKYNLLFSKMDSFAQFIIKSIDILNENGTLGFVLPSSILNIATHEEIRKLLLSYDIEYIKRIGREFEEIVTDVIIVKISKRYHRHNKCFYDDIFIDQEKFKKNPYSNFLLLDNTSKRIINKLKRYPSYKLDNDVKYALGVVTGNNKKYLSNVSNLNNEPIISGKEIDKYNIDYSKIKKYIVFDKDNLQQVAEEELYRSKNKIVYRFIGKRLCFSVEDSGMLTLNSANIIVLGDNYDLYYVSAILNSRITQLYFEDVYNTHKVLKNHIKSFYIPKFNDAITKNISNLSKNVRPQFNYCEEIEEIIYQELNLNENEIKYIKNRF